MFQILGSLSKLEALLFDTTCALVAHFACNRYEPQSPVQVALLLLVLPALPTIVLVPHFTSKLVAVAIAYSLYYSVLVLSIVSYRLSPFHPLAEYPGPVLARISKLWGVWLTHTGKTHIEMRRLHDIHGSYVRIGPNELSICDKAALGPVLGQDGLAKGPIWDGRVAKRRGLSLIAIRDTPVHLHRRKEWNMAFSSNALKDYEPLLQKRINILVDQLEKRSETSEAEKSGKAVNIAEWMSNMTVDFMGDMGFGGGFELMRKGDEEQVWHLIEKGMKFPCYVQHVPVLADWLNASNFVIKATQHLRNFAHRRTVQRMKSGSQQRDLMSYFLHEGETDSDVPERPIGDHAADGILVIIAGSDTTSTVMSNVWYFLLTHPEAFIRLRDEVDKAFPPNEVLDGFDANKLAEMPYLNAVINESLRLFPAVPVSVQRSVDRGTGGRMIGDRFIPEGTAINVPPYVIQRDPSYFSPFPDSFMPERWLKRDSSEKKSAVQFHTDTSAFLPFSLGPMNCVGKNMAMLEMRVVISTLVRKFDMKLAEGYDWKRWEEDLEDWMVFAKGELPVNLRQRKT